MMTGYPFAARPWRWLRWPRAGHEAADRWAADRDLGPARLARPAGPGAAPGQPGNPL